MREFSLITSDCGILYSFSTTSFFTCQFICSMSHMISYICICIGPHSPEALHAREIGIPWVRGRCSHCQKNYSCRKHSKKVWHYYFGYLLFCNWLCSLWKLFVKGKDLPPNFLMELFSFKICKISSSDVNALGEKWYWFLKII